MSFDKDYPNRKDKRKPYDPHSAKGIDRTCRNHGSCPACQMNRKHKVKKQEDSAEDQLKEIQEGE